jgi:hypothetical protein
MGFYYFGQSLGLIILWIGQTEEIKFIRLTFIVMLPLFEDITYDLTEKEKKIVPIVVRGLASKVGSSMAVTNKEIQAGMKRLGHKVTDSRVRKLINYIRFHHLVPRLIATSKGYYVSNEKEEILKYISSLQARLNEINIIRTKLIRDLEEFQATLLNSVNL